MKKKCSFPEQKLREFTATRCALQEMLKGALQAETKKWKVHKILSKVIKSQSDLEYCNTYKMYILF